MRMQICAGIVAFALCNVAGAVVRCVDGDGKVSYQDFACLKGKQRDVALINNTVDLNLKDATSRTVAEWRNESIVAEAERQRERAAAASRVASNATRAAAFDQADNEQRVQRAHEARGGIPLFPHGLPGSLR